MDTCECRALCCWAGHSWWSETPEGRPNLEPTHLWRSARDCTHTHTHVIGWSDSWFEDCKVYWSKKCARGLQFVYSDVIQEVIYSSDPCGKSVQTAKRCCVPGSWSELLHDGLSLFLRHVTMHGRHREVCFTHLLRQPVHLINKHKRCKMFLLDLGAVRREKTANYDYKQEAELILTVSFVNTFMTACVCVFIWPSS